MNPKILIVDDYIEHANNLKELLTAKKYLCTVAFSAEDADKELSNRFYNLLILDNKLPGIDGLDFVEKLRSQQNDIPIIMYSAFGDSHIGHTSAQLGVLDFIQKGEDLSILIDRIEELIQRTNIVNLQRFDADYFKQKFNFVGVSGSIKKLFKTIEQVAATNARILICGETGVGKNLLAEAIHQISDRSDKPFVWLDCTTIPENLLESELFGHERGAFTGADKKQLGRLVMADHGTLFIDQIDDLGLPLQAKMLRLIETGKYEPVGSNQEQEIDVRIICASLKDLKSQVEENKFREDLYYRIAQVELFIPPLRHRKEDIVFLARHFIRKLCMQYKKATMVFSTDAMNMLLSYNWPGNVRELQFFIERLVIFINKGFIQKSDLELLQISKDKEGMINEILPLKEAKQNFEKEYIIKSLIANNGKVSAAAKQLQTDRTNLYKKIQLYGIKIEHPES
jgi:DNA-binding NtrC family response regulator